MAYVRLCLTIYSRHGKSEGHRKGPSIENSRGFSGYDPLAESRAPHRGARPPRRRLLHCCPAIFRLLWALGLEISPPFFLGFRELALLMGTFFGVLEGRPWGIGMWLWGWQGEVPTAIAVAITVFEAVLAGLFFGLVMAWYGRWKAERLGLQPSWEDYPEA